jgi:hypothetical protein
MRYEWHSWKFKFVDSRCMVVLISSWRTNELNELAVAK